MRIRGSDAFGSEGWACVDCMSRPAASLMRIYRSMPVHHFLPTYLEYGFTFIVKLSFYFFLETERWLALNFTQSTCGYNFKFRGGRRCLPPTRYSDSAYDPGGSSVSRKENEENQRKGRINLTNIISHVGLRPGIGVSWFGQVKIFA